MIRHVLALLALLAPLSAGVHAEQPNIVIIVADDLGYSDIGCYGGEIETPHLDRLAAEGVRFTQFYNDAKCKQTRAALLSGLYHHQTQRLELRNHVTIAEVLRGSGYRTLMSGKWHLPQTPTERGFDRYFGFLNGAVNFWTGAPCSKNKKPRFRLDDKEFKVPPKGFYTTDAFTDYAIDFVDEAVERKKPFFLYLAHNAPHYPLHAWPEDIARYRNRYQGGWDALRAERLDRMRKLGVVDADLELSVRDPNVPAWDTLGEETREEQSLLMAVYAAMVDRLDQNIGRLMKRLEELGVDSNTLVMFFSDNGGCPYQNEEKPESIPGGQESHRTYNTPWAHASNTPFRLYKRHAHEGGVATPMIVRWPGGIARKGAIIGDVGHLIDLLPTCLELSGAKYPRSFAGHDLLPLEGHSLLPVLHGKGRKPTPIFWEYIGHHAVRTGDHKLVAECGRPWSLYNVVTDRLEEEDLAQSRPELVGRLATLYEAWAERVGAMGHAQAEKSEVMEMKNYKKVYTGRP